MGDHQNGHILGIEWEFMSETQCHTPTIWDELYPIEFVLTWGLFISAFTTLVIFLFQKHNNNDTGWRPSSLAKLVQITIITMSCIFGWGPINIHITGGPHPGRFRMNSDKQIGHCSMVYAIGMASPWG